MTSIDGVDLVLQDPWWKLERTLLMEAKAQRTARLASKEHHQHLVAGLDWHTFRQVIRTIPGERKPHLRTWTQAAIHFKEDGKPKMCPICKVPATHKAHFVVVQMAPNPATQANATRLG